MRFLLEALWNADSGQDLAEYALLLALIALVAIVAITLLGTNIADIFNDIASALS